MRKRIWQRMFACMMACMILFGLSVPIYADDTDGSPNLILSSESVYEVESGKNNSITMQIKNKGNGIAENVVVKAKSEEAIPPFKLSISSGENVGNLGSNGYATIKLSVDFQDVPDKASYPITISYTGQSKSGGTVSGSETIYLKLKGFEKDPAFLFEQVKTTPESIKPGGSATLSGVITNTGGQDMYQAQVVLENLTTEGINLSGGFSSVQFGKLAVGQSSSFSFPLSTNADMASGNYPVTIKLKYQDGTGKEFEKTQDYYINVGSVNKQTPEVIIRKMTEPSGTYDVNQNFNIQFELYNAGQSVAKDIVVNAEGLDAAAVVPKSTSVKNIPSLAPGASMPLMFTFAATNQASTQNYAVQFSVEYKTGGDKTNSFKQFAGVNVVNSVKDKKEAEENKKDEEEKTSKPKIIVSKYSSNPLIVMAGEEFDLNLTLMNTHKDKRVQNIKMFLTLAEETSSETQKSGNIFTPVDSSNTFYFDAIPPKGTVDRQLRLYVVPDAQPKTYTLTVNFEYEDTDGKEYTATELLGINVKQNSELNMDEIVLPPTVEQYMPVTISFNYYNTGKVSLNNVMFRIEGDVECTQKSTYIGNMDSGASDYYEVSFTPNTLGEVPVSVIASYEDASGETIEQRRDFVLNVTEPMPMDDEFNMQPEPTGINKKMIGIIAGGVLVVVIIVVIVVGKVRKKKEDALIEAEEEDIDDIEDNNESEATSSEGGINQKEENQDKEGMPL